jgi:hypothetical protein
MLSQAGKIVDTVGSLEQKARLYSGLASQAAAVAVLNPKP